MAKNSNSVNNHYHVTMVGGALIFQLPPSNQGG